MNLNNSFWQAIPQPILCLAPMAGITDSAFRLLCKENGADVVYSEMASAAALFFKPQKTFDLIRFSLQEGPYVVQLFGKDPEHFAKATQIISRGVPVIYLEKTRKQKCILRPPSGIDINFGCPAKKVFGHGSGAALMDNPLLAKKIIEAVAKNTKLPVSIKVRSEVKGVKLLNFLKTIKINSLGISAIMIHGRSYQQGFSGPVDCKAIKDTVKYFKGIVIANGGIKSKKDGKEILTKTNAHGVGIATGSYGKPEIFQELQTLKKEPKIKKRVPREKNKIKLAERHAELVYKLKGEHGIIELRKHLLWYFKGIPNIKKLRSSLVGVTTLGDVLKVIKEVRKLYKT